MRKYYFSLRSNLHILAFASLLFTFNSINAQVGIGTTDPQAMLDVVASDPDNPTAKDGFLMPRVTSLTQDFQATAVGTMVFYNGPTGTGHGNMKNTVYFFDGNNWKNMSGEIASATDPKALYEYDATNKGVVFWIDPDDPYHYKIVSPVEFDNVPFGDSDCASHMCGINSLGGFSKTKSWIQAHSGLTPSSYVNGTSYYFDGDSSVGNTHEGWYTPSHDEMVLLINDRTNISGSFPSGGTTINPASKYYYTSNQDYNSFVLAVTFQSGAPSTYYISKMTTYSNASLRVVKEIGG